MFKILNRIKIKLTEEGFYGLLKSIIRMFYVSEFSYKMNDILLINIERFRGMFSNDLRFVKLNSEFLNLMSLEYSKEINKKKTAVFKKNILASSTDKCFLVLSKNDICGYYHIAFGANLDPLVNYKIPNNPDDIYLFDDYTFKKHRGRGAHSFSIYSRLQIGKDKGYKTASVHIIKGAVFSEKAYMKLGFIKEKEIRLIKFLGLKKTFVTDIKFIR